MSILCEVSITVKLCCGCFWHPEQQSGQGRENGDEEHPDSSHGLRRRGPAATGSHRLLPISSLESGSTGLALRVVGICDSSSLIVVNDAFKMELNDDSLKKICTIKSTGSSLSSMVELGSCHIFRDSEARRKVVDIAGLLGRSTGLVVADCSASSETLDILRQAAGLGCCIVLANKKPLTSKLEDYENLISNIRRIRFESTVGAGLPVIAAINRVLSSGDPIYRIVGSLSGTLGYVMSELEDGKLLSHVVQDAKRLGYTEPDPRDDLSGMDVARKALILSRLLGQQINLEDIKVDSLYPEEMGPKSMSIDVGEKIKMAASKGNVVKYVCIIEGLRCQVGLQELPKDSPLGRLKGSENVVEIYSRCYKESPLVIQGAGAGNDTTAAGVLADIVDLQDLFE
ncbi:hypothetical protein HPP92_026459 [Vanilla planifolia]|uniref:Homoserine dehydrogenase n=1 Tax=Vanilla planifolia TaxID=51239 RepID=A0A835U753_VANPL|nr:hypothetical protein HPP92_026681 [Vanilla planifolia]KAG0450988.1 hypothetical protein HPP92_026459 [Vanilla planifolia]